jgi:4-amino-4-deoxy-L-arabinose transferase-like glycosyltransferase
MKFQRFLSQDRVLKVFREAILLALLGLAFAIPRLVGLGRFVTADEPTWGKRAATFYLALSKGNYSATFLSPHPGVTTMWAGAGAYHLKFPKYQRVGELRIGDSELFEKFYRHGPRPIEVLATARALVVMMNLVAFLVGFIYARRLFGLLPALVGFLFIAFDPFYLAHSRLLHVDALLSSFLFLSILAYLVFLKEGSWWALLVSAVAAGLSLLTKTPALILLPLLLLLSLLNILRLKFVNAPGNSGALRKVWIGLLLWGCVALLVVFLLWPALWNNPLGIIKQILTYSLDSAEGELGGAQFVEAFQAGDKGLSNYWYFYPLSFLWRTTPLILIGLFTGLLAIWKRWPPFADTNSRFAVLGLILFTLAFAVLMTLGSKKFDRYLLPVYLPLDLIAGLGWISAAGRLARVKSLPAARPLAGILLLTVLTIQAAGTLIQFPYYLTYYNPLLGGSRKAQQVMMIGWGEGLNEAAAYLRQVPDIQDRLVYSWYTLAFDWYSASYKYMAEQIPFPSGSPEKARQAFETGDYIVVYVNQWQRDIPETLFDYLKTKTPEHTVWIDGIEYVRIYKVKK